MLALIGFGQKVGDSWGDGFGTCIARVDDLDCDGLADFAVGAPYCSVSPDIVGWTPRIFLYSSATGVLIRELATTSREQIAQSVSSAPDINGDGVGEIISGRVVFSGFDGRELLAPRSDLPAGIDFFWYTPCLVPAPMPGEPKLADLDRLFYSPCAEEDRRVIVAAYELVRPRLDVMGVLGWPLSSVVPTHSGVPAGNLRLSVETVPWGRFRSSYTLVLRSSDPSSALLFPTDGKANWIGDVDHDGLADFAVPGSGTVQVHSGRTGAVLHALSSPGPGFGYSIAGGEDLDADGTPDVLVGTSSVEAELIEVFSGATGHRLVRIVGGFFDHLGTSVTFLGDIDGDRVPEIATGSLWIGLDIHWGEVIVYSGRTKQVLYRVQSPYLKK